MAISLRTKLFMEHGFIRKRCRNCGAYFWTLDPDREFCGDQPCVDYTFLGNPPTTRKNLSMNQVRECFLSFMEERGHTRVKRYPVVARWRDDVYLVGASIYNFQPWVTEGVVPPPANPLTISQPCIRLTDVDNVGRSGRHLTEFEMMAHHAFNYPEKNVYWIDETVQLAFDFFTEELGVPPEAITFKEDWWSGGGNAGEDFEVLVEGLEVATLVFMHYRTTDDKLIEMKNKIVDTGYGLERIVWLTKGTPTVYDAIFPQFIDSLSAMAGLEKVDDKILISVARIAGKFDVKRIGLVGFRKRVADEVGLSLGELEALLTPLENVYILADHTRTLSFMLHDGVVPSNVGAGYLARLLIRRSLRSIMALGLECPLDEIMTIQLKYLDRDFPELKEVEDVILDIINIEEKRFKTTLRKGRELVKRRASRLLSKGVKELPIEDLIELYDSHGLDPIVVKEVCEGLGMSVEIPEDFYTRLAERHQATKSKPKKAKLEISEPSLEDLPPTIPLYYEDQYATDFLARVLRVINGRYVILDRTLFYPEGGGQPADRGYLILPDGSKVEVLDVQKVGKVIVHITKTHVPLRGGEEVKGHIDSVRRRALMRNHTATHILIGAARKVLGPHVWQAGASKGVERSHLDITHYKSLTLTELRNIELLANRVVMENRSVKTHILDREKAEAKYGFTLYQGGVVPGRRIRIVEIEDWDVEACGGTHCRTTGEIGLIKIIRSERIQDGVVRLEFSVGDAALKRIYEEEDVLKALSDMLNAPREGLVRAVDKLRQRVKVLRKEVESLKRERVLLLSKKLMSEAKTLEGIKVVLGKFDGTRDDAIKIAENITSQDPSFLVVLIGTEGGRSAFVVVKIGQKARRLGISARDMAFKVSRVLGGSGGGTEVFAQGGGTDIDRLDEALEIAHSLIFKTLPSNR